MADVRTSETDPIRVDWIAESLPGRIGLSFAPGKWDLGESSGARWQRSLEADLELLAQRLRVSVLVPLLEDPEFALLRIPGYLEAARRSGFEVLRLPIPDRGCPAEIRPVREVVTTILTRAHAGSGIAIHCRGGLGRAGTVGACCLVALGRSAPDAIAHVRAVRSRNAVETVEQEAFVHRFARG